MSFNTWPAVSSAAAILAATAALSTSCAPLPDLRVTGCGDRILDEGEDCDGASAFEGSVCADADDEHACHYICDEEDGAVCPDGWGCGLDGLCSRPSGRFDTPASNAPVFLSTQEVVPVDVDGDGFVDLAGSDGATMSMRFGDGTGLFPTGVTVGMPPPTGLPAFAQLDSNVRTDVVVPLGPALLAFSGQASQTFEPIVFPSVAMSFGEVVAAGTTVEAVVADLGSEDGIGSEIFLVLNGSFGFVQSECADDAFPLPNGHQAGELQGRRIPTADLDGDRRTEVALAFAGADRVYFFGAAGDIEGTDPNTCLRPVPYGLTPGVTVPAGYTMIGGGAMFADVDGDTDRDLLLAVHDSNGAVEIALSVAQGDGSYEPAANLVPAFSAFAGGDDFFAAPLAAGDLDGDGRADYVFPGGVVLATGNFPGLPTDFVPIAFPRETIWTEAAVVDVNGDDAADVIAASVYTRGVDWFVNATTAGLAGRLNRFHVDTPFPVSLMRAADFSGDLLDDVAMVVQTPTGLANELYVAFSTASGAPTEPILSGALDEQVWFVEPAELPELGAPELDGVSDLIIMTQIVPPGGAQAGQPLVGIYSLQGSTAQRLLSPFFAFALSPEGELPNQRIVAALVGEFVPPAPEAPDQTWTRGVAAVAIPDELDADDRPTGRDANGVVTWVSSETTGELRPVPTPAVDLGPLGSFDPECALWLVGDLDPPDTDTGLDELLGIEASAACRFDDGADPRPLAIKLVRVPVAGAPPNATLIELPPAYAEVLNAHLADIDGDRRRDLILVVAASPLTPGRGAAVLVMWNDDACGAARFCTQAMATLEGLGGAGEPVPLDVAALQIGGDSRPELVALFTGAGGRLGLIAFESLPGSPRELRARQMAAPRTDAPFTDVAVADVDGDGLSDLVVSANGVVVVLLQEPGESLGEDAEREAAGEGTP